MSNTQPLWKDLDTTGLELKFAGWVEMIAEMHDGANHRVNNEVAFAALGGPLDEVRVALVSTAGVHAADQEAFDVSTTKGDHSFRLIPDDCDLASLRFTHTHYDTTSAEIDPNVVFPLQRLQELVASGRLGSTNGFHIGMMGFNPDPSRIADETAPEVTRLLVENGVDLVLLVPG